MIVRMGEAQLCVLCRLRPIDARWRPFCSERCRNRDLGAWASERYHVAAPAPADDGEASAED
jgi:endogenous inhibitor of DNA gyrase (YacG/DUF329 family)